MNIENNSKINLHCRVTKPEVKAEEEDKTPTGRGRKRKTEADVATPGVSDKKAKKEAEVRLGSF